MINKATFKKVEQNCRRKVHVDGKGDLKIFYYIIVYNAK